jgi:hypothetical protein
MARHRVLSIEPALAQAKPVAPSECMFDSATQPDELAIPQYQNVDQSHGKRRRHRLCAREAVKFNACRNRARTEDIDFSCRVNECSISRLDLF